MLSAFHTLGLMANAVAFAIAGVIVEAFGPRSVFALGAVVSALCLPFLRPMFRVDRASLTGHRWTIR